MTMPMDLFSPQDGSAPAPAPAGGDPQSASQEWSTVLQDPKVRASLLSFGLQLMQPPQFGQTAGGQIAQAIGAAGETLGNQDEQEMKEREQARKERDTGSMIDYRKDRSDIAATNADASTVRADAAARNAQSQALLRESQVQVNVARAGEIGSKVRMLEMRVNLFPQDNQAKIELARARTELLEAQTRVATEKANSIAPLTESRINVDNSRIGTEQSKARLNDTRAGAVDTNVDIAKRRLDIAEKKPGFQETLDRQKGERQLIGIYQKAKQEHEKNRYLDPKLGPFISYQKWKEENGIGGGTAPASPQTGVPDSQLPAAKMGDNARAPGRYMTPKGAGTWTGTGWTFP